MGSKSAPHCVSHWQSHLDCGQNAELLPLKEGNCTDALFVCSSKAARAFKPALTISGYLGSCEVSLSLSQTDLSLWRSGSVQDSQPGEPGSFPVQDGSHCVIETG